MNFDQVATPYNAIERIVFGRALERCRTALLPAIVQPRRALLIGEGDGRFLQRFLEYFPGTKMDVVEPSQAMIARARRRVGPTPNVRFVPRHILTAELEGPYDLVVTHFVLDIFTDSEVSDLARRLATAAPGGEWLISEFNVCQRPALARLASRACIATMYAFFRVAAGVQVRAVPNYAAVLKEHGFHRAAQRQAWRGFLSSELWRITA